MRKNDRKLKEIITQSEEEKRNQNRMQELVDKLESKLRSYKRQLEEAESIAAGCVAKNRKLQLELGNVVERATEAEFKANKRIFVSSGQSSNQVNEFIKLFFYLFLENLNIFSKNFRFTR